MAPIKVTPMKCLLAISMMLFVPVVVVADDAKNLLKPVNKTESWRLELHEGAQATFKIADDAVVFNATKLTGTNWHIQAFQVNLDLKEGKEYTVKLKFTASQRRNVTAGRDDRQGRLARDRLARRSHCRQGSPLARIHISSDRIVAKKNRIGFVTGRRDRRPDRQGNDAHGEVIGCFWMMLRIASPSCLVSTGLMRCISKPASRHIFRSSSDP